MLTINDAFTIAKEHSLSRYEAKLLLAHVLNNSLTWIDTWPESCLTDSQQKSFLAMCLRHQSGEPIPYLLGECSFWSLTLAVSPDTLIPRPETEHLVEWVLNHFADDRALTVADLGTGSGAIALVLALERPSWHIIATDRSKSALAIAQSNAKRLNLDGITWSFGSWFEALQGVSCDLIVSNPPYIDQDDPHLLGHGLPYEPVSALVAKDKGLADLKHLILESPAFLKPNGWLVLEHGYDQGDSVKHFFKVAGFSNITTLQDYAGHDRISCAQLMSFKD